jgi:hypothetical protein
MNTKPLDYAAVIVDIDAQINRLVGKRELLAALRDAGAVIEVPEQPAQAEGDATKEPDASALSR